MLLCVLGGKHVLLRKYLEEEIHCTSVSQLTMLSGWENYWGEEYTDFATRVHWLRAHLFKQNNQNNLAIMALQLIHDVVDCFVFVFFFGGKFMKCQIFSHFTRGNHVGKIR